MKKAVLNYVVKDQNDKLVYLPIETSSLYQMDFYTAQFKNDSDLIKDCPKRNQILEFIRVNGNEPGKFVISYVTNIYSKKNIPVLYDDPNEILINEDYINGEVSEVEKSRRLLFNSQGQIFSKLLLSDKDISECYNYRFSLSFQEYLAALKNNVVVEKRDDGYFIDFKELLKYRATHRKLGALRNVYEDMLDIWKSKLDSLNDEDYYYYSRQLRMIYNKYEKLKNRNLSISNLKVHNDICKKIYGRSVLTGKFNRYRIYNEFDKRKRKYVDVS